jgi:hypothetical protein
MLDHVLMMYIVVNPLSCALVRPFDVPAPKKYTVGNEGADLDDVQLVIKQVYQACILTAAFAMNIAYAKDPLRLGMPYVARASWLSTPPAKTLAIGYFVPSSYRSRVDMNGSDFEPQALV